MTSFRHDLTPDEPVVLDAGYEFDKAERRRIDEQIRDLQRAALDGFMRGTVTAYFVAAADLARGDVVCLTGSASPGGERRVTKATAAAMASAGTPVGIVMADAPKGASVRVAIAGVVPATVTGLLAGEPGFVRVSSIGRCERVATPAGGDVLLGSIDAAGTLAMAHGRGGTGGGGGATELEGDVTGPSDDTTVEAIQGTPVDSTPPEDGQVLAFVEADGKARWVTPGGGGGPVALGGDLDGTSDDATVVGIQGTEVDATPPTDGQVLAYDSGDGRAKWAVPPAPDADGIAFDPSGTGLSATDVQGAIVELALGAVPASPYLASVEIDLPTATSPEDFHVYTVPACIDATITFVLLSVEEQLQGAGTVTVRVGTTAGDDDLIIDSVVDSTTLKGNFAGKDISTLGTVWPASSGYVWNAAEGDEVHVRVTTNGTVDSGKIRVTVVGVIVR